VSILPHDVTALLELFYL